MSIISLGLCKGPSILGRATSCRNATINSRGFCPECQEEIDMIEEAEALAKDDDEAPVVCCTCGEPLTEADCTYGGLHFHDVYECMPSVARRDRVWNEYTGEEGLD